MKNLTTQRLRTLQESLMHGLIERDLPIRLALLAALSGEHLLLVGPPGTAKSFVARRLQRVFNNAGYFERLLTRFTVPEELFGPLSIKGLEQDRYERLTKSYLPMASIAFLDEIFKANSAILNALLTLLNEREFDNGAVRQKSPLIAVIGASNELPQGDELDALFDRFLFRLHVPPVSGDGFRDLLLLSDQGDLVIDDALKLTPEELKDWQHQAKAVDLPGDVIALLSELRQWCIAEDIYVSDRRWRKVVKMLQMAAFTNGRTAVSVWDGWLLQHCLWEKPEQLTSLAVWYGERVGSRASSDMSHLKRLVTTLEGRTKPPEQQRDSEGRFLYKDLHGKPTTEVRGMVQQKRGKELLYSAPSSSSTVGSAISSVVSNFMSRSNGSLFAGVTPSFVSTVASSSVPQQKIALTRAELEKVFDALGKDKKELQAYLDNPYSWLCEEGDLPSFMTADGGDLSALSLPELESRLRDVEDVYAELESYRAELEQHMAALQVHIGDHLWIPGDYSEPAAAQLTQKLEETDALLARVETLREMLGVRQRAEALKR